MTPSKETLEIIELLNAALEEANKANIADDRLEEILQETAQAAGFSITFETTEDE